MDKSTTEDKKEKAVIRRQYVGEVIATRGDKTLNVLVVERYVHPKYRKQYQRSKKWLVHDAGNAAKLGDKVLFEKCRPLSRMKRCRLVKIMN